MSQALINPQDVEPAALPSKIPICPIRDRAQKPFVLLRLSLLSPWRRIVAREVWADPISCFVSSRPLLKARYPWQSAVLRSKGPMASPTDRSRSSWKNHTLTFQHFKHVSDCSCVRPPPGYCSRGAKFRLQEQLRFRIIPTIDFTARPGNLISW